jgi:hypothetical protein
LGQWFKQVLQEAVTKLPYRNRQISDLLVNRNNTETSEKETSKYREVKKYVSAEYGAPGDTGPAKKKQIEITLEDN